MGVLIPVCQSCGKVPQFGLYDGFRLHGKFFCSECEKRLLEEEIGSSYYLHLAHQFRSLWHSHGVGILRSPAW